MLRVQSRDIFLCQSLSKNSQELSLSLGFQSLGIPSFMNLHSLNFQQLQKIDNEVKACLKAEVRTYIQKLDMFIDYYDEFNEYPDKDYVKDAKNSIDSLKRYIENMM